MVNKNPESKNSSTHARPRSPQLPPFLRGQTALTVVQRAFRKAEPSHDALALLPVAWADALSGEAVRGARARVLRAALRAFRQDAALCTENEAQLDAWLRTTATRALEGA